MITISNLTKSFKKTLAVNNFSFEFDNKIYGLLGPNGAGKTTLLRCLAGLYDYTGSIKENGKEISALKEHERNIGYLPQKFGMFGQLTVKEMLQYFCLQKGISVKSADIEACIKSVGLEDKTNKKISTLSGGMVRRLGIAQALLGKPSLIIFDEPTAGLDPEERIRFKNIVKSLHGKCTVILSTHIVSDIASVCDETIIMNDGKLICCGTSEEISQKAKNKVYLIPEEKQNLIKGKYYIIQNTSDETGKSQLRFVSQENQNFDTVEATVEDGYICSIKNI